MGRRYWKPVVSGVFELQTHVSPQCLTILPMAHTGSASIWQKSLAAVPDQMTSQIGSCKSVRRRSDVDSDEEKPSKLMFTGSLISSKSICARIWASLFLVVQHCLARIEIQSLQDRWAAATLLTSPISVMPHKVHLHNCVSLCKCNSSTALSRSEYSTVCMMSDSFKHWQNRYQGVFWNISGLTCM